jgi:hypothetical protein
VVGVLSCLVAFPVDLLFSRSSISRKKYVAKKLGAFDGQKVFKTQKICKNMDSCSVELKPKLSELFRKSLESMKKHPCLEQEERGTCTDTASMPGDKGIDNRAR